MDTVALERVNSLAWKARVVEEISMQRDLPGLLPTTHPFHSHDTIFLVTLVTLQLSQEGQGMLIRIASASEGPNEISRSGPLLEITHQIRSFCFLRAGN